jgi:hypothetical protein
MTAQFEEHLIYQGETFGLAAEPLRAWLERRKNKHIRFRIRNTACIRGYKGTWEIIDDRLYLANIRGHLHDNSEATLTTLFPESTDRVFADWFTGEVRCPVGRLLNYVHTGFSSVYECDFFWNFKEGVLISHRRVNNESCPSLDQLPNLVREFPQFIKLVATAKARQHNSITMKQYTLLKEKFQHTISYENDDISIELDWFDAAEENLRLALNLDGISVREERSINLHRFQLKSSGLSRISELEKKLQKSTRKNNH